MQIVYVNLQNKAEKFIVPAVKVPGSPHVLAFTTLDGQAALFEPIHQQGQIIHFAAKSYQMFFDKKDKQAA